MNSCCKTSVALFAIVMGFHAYSAEPVIAPDIRAAFTAITADARVKQGLDFLKADDANTLADQKALVVIPAPPFKEQVRAENFRARLAALGLKDVRLDKEGNAIGVRPGSGGGP